jgi:hypothetical protein
MSYQAFLENRTPFSAKKFVLPDVEGQETIVVVAAATFEGDQSGRLNLAEQQRPVPQADEYFGEPGLSSVRCEAEIAFQKPLVDVLVNGSAYAPGGRPATTVPVRLTVGDIRKDLIVTGDRVWRSSPVGGIPSSPRPFVSLPVVYERAFGGVDRRSSDPAKHVAEPRNLVGVGLAGMPSNNPSIATELPNIERPDARMASQSDRFEPAGLGIVSRGWMPRLKYAGTYDERWLDERWPLLPMDFDLMYNQAAPPDQQSRSLVGGEFVQLLNLTPEGDWRFTLPRLRIPILLLYDNRRSEGQLRLDTILIEPDVHRVTLISRIAGRVRRNHGLLREIVLGSVTDAWIRARVAGKRYVARPDSSASAAGRYFSL